MDPFSLVAGLAGISDVATKTTSVVFRLVGAWREAPEEVHHLRDQIASANDFFARVRLEVDQVVSQGRLINSPFVLEACGKLLGDLTTAQSNLLELCHVLEYVESVQGVAESKEGSPQPEVEKKLRKDRWLRKRARVHKLRKLLQEAQSSILEGLLSMNVTLTTEVHSQISQLKKHVKFFQLETKIQQQRAISSTEALMDSNKEMFTNVNRRIDMSRTDITDHFNRDLQDQLHQHTGSLSEKIDQNGAKTFERLDLLIQSLRGSDLRAPDKNVTYSALPTAHNLESDSSSLEDTSCGCPCHIACTTSIWKLEKCKWTIGSVVFAYTTRPSKSSDCACCNTYSSRWIRAAYTFPRWLVNMSMCMLYSRHTSGMPEFLLRVIRHIPADASKMHSTIVGCLQRRDLHGARLMLRSKQASPFDVCGRQDRPLLIQACFYNDSEMAKLLISYGADPLAPEALSYCSLYPRVHTYWDFLRNDVGINIPISAFFKEAGLTELHKIVVGIFNLSLQDALLQARYNVHVNTGDSRGCTPLHYAASMGNASYVSTLISHGAYVDSRTHWKSTPLYEACLTGKYEAARILLENGAEVDARVQHNATPLRVACDYGNSRLVALLIACGADLHAMNFRNNCKLDAVVYNDNSDVLRYLLSLVSGDVIDHRDAEGESVAFRAIAWDAAKCLRLILKHDPDLGIVNNYGWTVLHRLAASAGPEVFRMFADVFASRNVEVDACALDLQGRSARGLFNERVGITEELRAAFNIAVDACSPGQRTFAVAYGLDKPLLGEKILYQECEGDSDVEDDRSFDAIPISS